MEKSLIFTSFSIKVKSSVVRSPVSKTVSSVIVNSRSTSGKAEVSTFSIIKPSPCPTQITVVKNINRSNEINPNLDLFIKITLLLSFNKIFCTFTLPDIIFILQSEQYTLLPSFLVVYLLSD